MVVVRLLESSLKASAADIRMLLEALLLFSDSDSEAAVDAEADLLSLAAALALSLELPLWLLLWEVELSSEWDSERERVSLLVVTPLVEGEPEKEAFELPGAVMALATAAAAAADMGAVAAAVIRGLGVTAALVAVLADKKSEMRSDVVSDS